MQLTTPTDVPEDDDNDINLTPMLDVVFIMLIFFIVTASFIKEAGIAVDRPEGNASINKPPTAILISINEHSEIWMDGRMLDPRAVRANIARSYAENPQASVVISADKHSFNDTLLSVMNASREAGIYEIGIAPSADHSRLD